MTASRRALGTTSTASFFSTRSARRKRVSGLHGMRPCLCGNLPALFRRTRQQTLVAPYFRSMIEMIMRSFGRQEPAAFQSAWKCVLIFVVRVSVNVRHIERIAVEYIHMLLLIDLAEIIGVHSVLVLSLQSATRRSSASSTTTDTVVTAMTRRRSSTASSMTTNPTATTRTVRLKHLTIAVAQFASDLSMCIRIVSIRTPHVTR